MSGEGTTSAKALGYLILRTGKEASKVRGTRERGLVMQTVTGHRPEWSEQWKSS